MATEILHNKNLKIQAYSLPDMLQEVQQGILDGYRLDYDQNETYPFGSGSYFEVTLVPVKSKKEDKVVEKQQSKEELHLNVSVDTSQAKAFMDEVDQKVKKLEGSDEVIEAPLPDLKVDGGKPGRKPKGK